MCEKRFQLPLCSSELFSVHVNQVSKTVQNSVQTTFHLHSKIRSKGFANPSSFYGRKMPSFTKRSSNVKRRYLIPLAIPTLKWGSRDPKSYQFYTDQSCSKMLGHISQEYELTKKQTNKKGVFHSVSILERTTVRQKCSLVGLELEVATSC